MEIPCASVSKRVFVQRTFDMKTTLICMKMNMRAELIFICFTGSCTPATQGRL